MKKANFILTLFFLITFIANPRICSATETKVLPQNAKLFIAPMEESLDQFIKSEIFRQKLSLSVVLDEKSADYIVTGTMVKKEGSDKWYHYMLGTAGTSDSAQGTINLIQKNNKTLLWSTNAGDRSTFFGMMKKKGQRKVAQRLVTSLKKIIQN